MAQRGYYSCICCGRLYKEDGSEEDLWDEDHPANSSHLQEGLAKRKDLH